MIDVNLPFQFSYNLITLYPLVFLLGSLAVGDVRGKRSFLNLPVMQWLGNISFGFYMIHFSVLIVLKRWIGDTKYDFSHGIMLVAFAAVVSVILGWVLYKFVEIPCGNYLNSLTKSKKVARTMTEVG